MGQTYGGVGKTRAPKNSQRFEKIRGVPEARSIGGVGCVAAAHGGRFVAWCATCARRPTYLRFFNIASSLLSLRIWIMPSSRLRRASSASVAFLKLFLRASVRDEGRSIVAGREHETTGKRRVK